MNRTAAKVWGVAIYEGKAGAIVLLGFIFAVSSWWRSSRLGFYSDDWLLLSKTIYLQGTLAEYLGANGYARPIYGLITWLLNLLANGSPSYWQVISSGTVLASAAVSYRLIAYMAGRLGYGALPSLLGGLCGTVVLFFSPWMLAVFAWSTGVLTLWSLILFGVGYLMVEETESARSKCVGSVLVLAGFLCYEAYWFTFVPLLLISKYLRFSSVVAIARAALWYGIPLALAVSYQLVLVPLMISRPAKAISANFPLMLNNLANFDRFVSPAIAPAPTKAFYLALLALVAILLVVKAISLARLALVVAALGLGVIFTAVIYGAAGYGLAGTGVMSRTMAAPGLYFAILIGILAAATADRLSNKVRVPRIAYAAPLIFGILSAIVFMGFFSQISEWTSSKEASKRVLDSLVAVVDSAYLRKSSKGVSVVVQIEGDQNGELFGASYELGGAVALTKPTLVPTKSVSFVTARQGAWGTVWDGEVVVQTVCSGPLGNVAERHPSQMPPLYYRIDPRDGKVFESGFLVKDNLFGCKGSEPTVTQP